MCGIVGMLNLGTRRLPEEATLRRMLAMLRHRGPDGFGIYLDADVGLGNARLSIIDPVGGQQPISNEDGTLWIVCNGEVFNYVELRPQLERRGHRFATQTDTEVILHLYEDYGPDCLAHLNGQFALAIWDRHRKTLFVARDRVGIRPLFYTEAQGRLIFGSEIKALLAHPGVAAEIDPQALEQIFTFWSTLSPRTAFRHICEVPPGHYLQARRGGYVIHPYWSLDFRQEDPDGRSPESHLEELESLLADAVRIRLRADVPVGAYLSGGLDSSLVTAMAGRYASAPLTTFSISFAEREFDESEFQAQAVHFLGTDHHMVRCTDGDIGRAFADAIWHIETPILRTAPVPMYLLSRAVHDSGLKVVLTGEGADEILAGYDIFKEMKVRRFWARRPGSALRPLLLETLHRHVAHLGRNGYLKASFGKALAHTGSPFYSHLIRWTHTGTTRRFLSHFDGNVRPAEQEYQGTVALPPSFEDWSPLAQAQYLEMSIFMSEYLLSSQGDRVAMAHAVEGRFPFLDHRVIELCNRLPDKLKLPGLREKWLLKQLGRKMLPSSIWQRPKRPYRAPIRRSLFDERMPDEVRDVLDGRALREAGLFRPDAVAQLVRKAEGDVPFSEIQEMALAGILSAQLVYHQFVKTFCPSTLTPSDQVKVVDRIRSGRFN